MFGRSSLCSSTCMQNCYLLATNCCEVLHTISKAGHTPQNSCCKPAGLSKYGWEAHDGEGFGRQELHDGQLHLTTTWVKHDSKGCYGGDWGIRITARCDRTQPRQPLFQRPFIRQNIDWDTAQTVQSANFDAQQGDCLLKISHSMVDVVAGGHSQTRSRSCKDVYGRARILTAAGSVALQSGLSHTPQESLHLGVTSHDEALVHHLEVWT